MSRVKRGVTSHAKHKKVLKQVKGQFGRRKNTIRIARQALEKAMQYAYRDRRNKKREFRSLWIQRINAGVRSEGLTYSKFINGLNKSGINSFAFGDPFWIRGNRRTTHCQWSGCKCKNGLWYIPRKDIP